MKPLEEIEAGEVVQRNMFGIKQELKVTAIDDKYIHCGPWKFDIETGKEVDEDLSISPSFIISTKHEYLRADEYYEERSVGTKAGAWTCEHCGNVISAGVPHANHKFYPDFTTYRTHHACTEAFKKSLN